MRTPHSSHIPVIPRLIARTPVRLDNGVQVERSESLSVWARVCPVLKALQSLSICEEYRLTASGLVMRTPCHTLEIAAALTAWVKVLLFMTA
ncbi:hypothetical protein EV182_007897 [Spiromyces aspiralis]|uniref:Uncharacterized protein n=1 Tax=Spiromyces aspiralis TaxID=68401 RepID=A0ACC1H7I4_9FUNG|nr:hypothetical protein EV182_007897 [Spiromyces aspiralis]